MSDPNFEEAERAAGMWSHTGDHPDQIPLLQKRIAELESKLERQSVNHLVFLSEHEEEVAELESKLARLPTLANYRRLLEYASSAWHQIECEWGIANDPPDADILLIDRLIEAFIQTEEK